eukprot:7200069-Pyramimonas_sp.AAC.1
MRNDFYTGINDDYEVIVDLNGFAKRAPARGVALCVLSDQIAKVGQPRPRQARPKRPRTTNRVIADQSTSQGGAASGPPPPNGPPPPFYLPSYATWGVRALAQALQEAARRPRGLPLPPRRRPPLPKPWAARPLEGAPDNWRAQVCDYNLGARESTRGDPGNALLG